MKSPRPITLFLFCAVPALLAVTPGVGPQTSRKHQPAASTAAEDSSRHQQTAPRHHPSLGSPIIFVQTPELAEGDLRARFPQGSHIARLDAGAEAASPINLTPEFFAAADPQISFDASRVLFAAQEQSGSRWQVWEMDVDGSSKRRVTTNQADCLRPAYLAHESLAFTVVREDAGRAASEVHVAKLDGTEDHAITFGPGNYQVETVLKDGRILLSAASPLVGKGANSTALYVIRHDGTGMQSLRCEHAKPALRREAAELADGSVVFVKSAVAKRARRAVSWR